MAEQVHLRACADAITSETLYLEIRSRCMRHRKRGRHLGLRSAYETGSSQPTDRFQRTEDLADALSRSPANPVAVGPGGSPIEARGLSILGARDVRPYMVLAQVPCEHRPVVAFVGADGLGVNVAA